MMNFDGILSEQRRHVADYLLECAQLDQPTNNNTNNNNNNNITVEEGAIEEEQAAIIQTVPLALLQQQQHRQQQQQLKQKHKQNRQKHRQKPKKQQGQQEEEGGAEEEEEEEPLKQADELENIISETAAATTTTTTPQRKISTSSRFISAFQQFYTTATTTSGSVGLVGETTATANETNFVQDTTTATTMPINVELATRTPSKNMESKLMSMWHNVKYGWSGKMRVNFSKEQPVWLLGRCYHRKSATPPSSMENSTEFGNTATSTVATASDSLTNQGAVMPIISSLYPIVNPQKIDEIIVPQELGTDAAENQLSECAWEEGFEGFRRDFYSRIWMTYRREFPLMNGSNYTSDCGWGCMLRSGQMLLAQALVCHFLSRSWRYDADTQLHNTNDDIMHKRIIKWFGDSSSKSSPFSIHTMVSLGEKLGKKPGDWYGPASVSYLLKHALKNAAQENADFDNIAIYVAKNCTIYMQDIEDECSPLPAVKSSVLPWQTPKASCKPLSKKSNWKSLIVLIPLRLGTEKLNPVYAHCLKLLLSTEYCIGIIGGRPKHSLYFVGFQEDRLIHLDPHYCQDVIDVNQDNFSLQSFHCKSPRKLKTSKMDPSCCIGFYCATKNDFHNFVESVQVYLHPLRCASGSIERVLQPGQQMPQQEMPLDSCGNQQSEMTYPLFSFSRGRCQDHETNVMSDSYYKPVIAPTDANCEEHAAYSIEDADDDDIEIDGETEEFVML